jgi:hypothetical protein
VTPTRDVLLSAAWFVLFVASMAGLVAPMFLGAARVVAHPEPCACERVP